MNQNLIPLKFADSHFTLTWMDLLWGYKKNILTWRDLVEVAITKRLAGSENTLELKLAEVDKEGVWKVSELVQELSEQEGTAEEESKHKWLILCLAWAYKNREGAVDPLETVEMIYADFDYPAEIDSFVRFIPPPAPYDPSQFTLEQNRRRLMENWEKYLKQNNALVE